MLAAPLDNPALVIFDGSPAAAVAVGLLAQPERSVIWVQQSQQDPRHTCVMGCAAAMGDATGARVLTAAVVTTAGHTGGDPLAASVLLLEATRVAYIEGLSQVVQGVAMGDEGIAAIGDVVDRCGLVSGLAQIDIHSQAPDDDITSLAVIAPLVDLKLAQVAELFEDLALPRAAVGICDRAQAPGCGACAGCRRWTSALQVASERFDVAAVL